MNIDTSKITKKDKGKHQVDVVLEDEDLEGNTYVSTYEVTLEIKYQPKAAFSFLSTIKANEQAIENRETVTSNPSEENA